MGGRGTTSLSGSAPSYEAIIDKLEEVSNGDYPFEYFGVRTQDEKFSIGPIEHRSHEWVDGWDTDNELEGVSVTLYSTRRPGDIRMHAEGYERQYYGRNTAILGWNSSKSGFDPGEEVAEDAEVLFIWDGKRQRWRGR